MEFALNHLHEIDNSYLETDPVGVFCFCLAGKSVTQELWSRPVSGLNENHKRRLVSAFKHADVLLSRSLDVVKPARPGKYSSCVQDTSTSEVCWVESYIEKIRDRLYGLLQKFEIELPPPSTRASWTLKVALTTLDLALEELYPEQMRGYGQMDDAAASELTRTLDEIRMILNQLSASL